MLKRSVDGGAMGLNSLCILVDRHLNRLESSSKTAIMNALKELGRSVDQYDKYSLAEMCKIMREADQGKSLVLLFAVIFITRALTLLGSVVVLLF
jgi:hypothetical protein